MLEILRTHACLMALHRMLHVKLNRPLITAYKHINSITSNFNPKCNLFEEVLG